MANILHCPWRPNRRFAMRRWVMGLAMLLGVGSLQAHLSEGDNGQVYSYRLVSLTPTIDGTISDPAFPDEWRDAYVRSIQLITQDGSTVKPAYLFLAADPGTLDVGVAYNATSVGDNGYTRLYFDVNHNHQLDANVDLYFYLQGQDSPVLDFGYWDGTQWVSAGSIPAGVTMVAGRHGTGSPNTWNFEFKIPLSVLGVLPGQEVGLLVEGFAPGEPAPEFWDATTRNPQDPSGWGDLDLVTPPKLREVPAFWSLGVHPALDGDVSGDEAWQHFSTHTQTVHFSDYQGNLLTGTLYAKSSVDTVFLALILPKPQTAGDSFVVLFDYDANDPLGSVDWVLTDTRENGVRILDNGTWRDLFWDQANVLWNTDAQNGVVAITYNATAGQYEVEMALPLNNGNLNDLAVSPKARIGVNLAFHDAATGRVFWWTAATNSEWQRVRLDATVYNALGWGLLQLGAPVLQPIHPQDGDTVEGSYPLLVWATSAAGPDSVIAVQYSYDGGVTWFDLARADATGFWGETWNTTALPDGPVELRFRAVDWQLDTTTVSLNVFINNAGTGSQEPPRVSIQDPVADSILGGTTTITFTVQPDSGRTLTAVEISVDGGPYVPVTSPPPATGGAGNHTLDTRSLTDGSHFVIIRAQDDAGQEGYSDPRMFVVDNAPPTIGKIDLSLPEGQIAMKDGDTLVLSAEVFDAISGVDTVYVDASSLGAGVVGLVDDGTGVDVRAGDGIYSGSLTVSIGGGNGTFSLLVHARDLIGNARTSDTVSVTVDNTPPALTEVSVLDPDNIYRNGETVRLLLTADAPGYFVQADFSAMDEAFLPGMAAVQDNGDGTYSITYTLSQTNTRPDGLYTISVTARDGAGLSTTATADLVLDNDGPDVLSIALAVDSLGDFRINRSDTLIARAADSEGVVAMEFFVDVIGMPGEGQTLTLDAPGADTVAGRAFLDVSGLAPGQHRLFVRAQDSTGIWGTVLEQVFVYDPLPPVISDIRVQYPEGQQAVRDGQMLVIIASISDPGVGLLPESLRVDASALNGNPDVLLVDNGTGADAFAGDGIFTAALTVSTGASGNFPFTIRAYDQLLNLTFSDSGFVAVDNDAPVLSAIQVQDPDNIYRNGETVRLLLMADAPGYTVRADFFPIDINYLAGSEIVQDNGDGTYEITYTISQTNTRPNGVYTITVRAMDGVGLADTLTVDLVLDNRGPRVISLALDDPDDTLNTDDTLRVVLYDSVGVVAAEFFIDNTGNPGEGIPLISTEWGQDTVRAVGLVSIENLEEGQHTLYVHAQDTAGTWGGFASLTFLKDTRPPLIQNVEVVYPDNQEAVAQNQTVIIRALVRDVTTRVTPESVYVDVSAFASTGRVPMVDDGSGADEVAGDNVYTAAVQVTTDQSGTFPFTVHAADVVANATSRQGFVNVDNGAPRVVLSVRPVPTLSDVEGEVYRRTVLLKGRYFDLPDSTVEGVRRVVIEVRDSTGEHVNTSPIEVPVQDGAFSREINLVEGLNIIRVYVEDRAGLQTYDSARIVYRVPEVVAEIGPEGGEIRAPDGTRLIIPEGALNTSVQFTIRRIGPEGAPPADRESLKLLRVVYEFLPHGVVFLKPVTVVLTYNDFDLDLNQDDVPDYEESALRPYFWDGRLWLVGNEAARLDPTANEISFEVNHLSIYALGVEQPQVITVLKAGWTRNPFRLGENSTFVFDLPDPGYVTLKIVDLSGDVIRTLADRVYYAQAGRYNLQWDGLNDFNRGLRDERYFHGSGTYIYVFIYEPDGGTRVVIRKPIAVVR